MPLRAPRRPLPGASGGAPWRADDAIDAPPLRLPGDHIEAAFLLERTGDEAPYRVTPPGGESDDLVDGGAGGSPQHLDDPGLLGHPRRPANPRRLPARRPTHPPEA